MNPDYIEKVTEDEVVFRNYEGNTYHYPLKSTPVKNGTAAPHTHEELVP
jgi:lysine 2,3-aminomutase